MTLNVTQSHQIWRYSISRASLAISGL